MYDVAVASSHKEARNVGADNHAWPGSTRSLDNGADASSEMVTSALIIRCTLEKMCLQAFTFSKTLSRNTEIVSELLDMLKQSKEVCKG
jgi:hypothetical protein